MNALDIFLLGEPRFAYRGSPWRFNAPPRALPLLAMLIVRGTSVSRVALAAELWPDDTASDARSNLRRHLYRIADALPKIDVPWIIAEREALRWNPQAPATIDALDFTRLLSAPGMRSLAIERYGGDFLAGSIDEWVLAERERLRRAYLTACYECAVEARRERRFAQAGEYVERILAVDEWREDALRLLMAIRYEAGDRSAALLAFERFAASLRDEMGVAPMPETLLVRDALLANEALPGADQAREEMRVMRDARALPFVGRIVERDELRAAWMRAARGAGGTLFVTGEPGIGKSRLIGEVAVEVEAEGGRVLVGRTAHPEGRAYQPFADVIRRALPLIVDADLEFVWLSVLAELVPEVHALVPDLPPAPELEPERARERLFHAIARCFEVLTRARPVMLVLEDIHWASEGTLDALAVVARRAGAVPLLVVASMRTGELDALPALGKLRRDLVRELRASSIPLRRLHEDDVRRIVTVVPELVDAPSSLAPAVFASSEGNPLFLTQLLREFIERGALPDDARAIASVQEIILRRIAHLNADTRAIAEAAATVGTEFSFDVIRAVGGWDEAHAYDCLAMLIDRGLVRETGGGGIDYAFSHALIQAALYEASEPKQRRLRHHRLAAILERAPEERGKFGVVARHWEAAGVPQRAAIAYVSAARESLALHAREEARDFAHRALACATEERTRFDAALVEAQALAGGGDAAQWDAAIRVVEHLSAALDDEARMHAYLLRDRHARRVSDTVAHERAVEGLLVLAEEASNERWRIEALDARGYYAMSAGKSHDAIDPLAAALALAERVGDARLVLRVREHLIQAFSRGGRVVEARRELERQRSDIERTGADDLRLNLLNAEASLAALVEDAPWCARVAAELCEAARGVGDVRSQAIGSALSAHAAYLLGNVDAMREHYRAAIECFARIDDHRSLYATYANRGFLEREIGHIDRAFEDWELAERYAAATGTDGPIVLAANRADAALERGDPLEALAYARRAIELCAECGESRLESEAYHHAGAARVALGERDAGIADLYRSLDGISAVGNERLRADVMCGLVDALTQSGRLDEAEPFASELASLAVAQPRAQRFPTKICAVLARFAAARGDGAGAAGWIASGCRLLDEMLRPLGPSDRAAYAALWFNRELAARGATT